ncbi:MAG: PH domain-containing protein [Phycisphaerae bacterium]|nr:PH domain-containing protein [Phycisphaerae bacterium]
MSPSVEPTTVTAPGLTVVPARLLDGGEVVLLAVKPSGCFCLLTSLPVLVTAVAFTAVAYLAGQMWSGRLQPGAIALFWAGVSIVRLIVAYLQWVARLYVLTNRRVLRVSGAFREMVHQCPLRHLVRAAASISPAERLLGVGSLSFESSDPAARQAHWAHVNYPAEVQQVVNEAIARAR